VRIQREPVLAIAKSWSRSFSIEKQIQMHLDRAQLGTARLQKDATRADNFYKQEGLQRSRRVTTNYALAGIGTSWRYIGRPKILMSRADPLDTTRQAVSYE
jgi:hypothetical protein